MNSMGAGTMFTVTKHENLEVNDKNARVIMPISMGKRQHSGDMLAALINFASAFNITILVADYLYRFNVGEERALQMGDKFLEKNDHILRKAIVIENVNDWNKYKDQHLLKIVRWATWREIKKEQWLCFKELIQKNSEKGSSLLASMIATAKSLDISTPEEIQASIDYQKEENVYLFTFCDEFDHHFYPGELNKSQAEVYHLFGDKYKFPKHVVAVLEKTAHVVQLGVFAGKNKDLKRKENSLHVSLRFFVTHIEDLMKSPEVPLSSKQLFIKKMNKIFQSIVPKEMPDEKIHKPG